MRFTAIVLFLLVSVLIPFLIWGEELGELFGSTQKLEGYGAWAWLAGMTLLVLDLFLPIPGTVVMAGLGYVYGAWLGGLVAAVGSVLSGLLAYGLCRALGRGVAVKVAGEEELAKAERVFLNAGGWIVALSRWLPMLPEVIACVAGVVRMPLMRFLVALACGSIPLGFAFAFIGSTGTDQPLLALGVSIALPPVLWFLVGRRMKRHWS